MKDCSSLPEPILRRCRSRGHAYIRGRLLMIREEDRSQFEELMRNRICNDFAFRELLFGHYTRMFMEEKHQACNEVAKSHYKVYMRRYEIALQESHLPRTGRWRRTPKTPSLSETEAKAIPKTKTKTKSKTKTKTKTKTKPTKSGCTGTNSAACSNEQGPLDDFQVLTGISWRRRYWMYLKFFMRHRDLPRHFVAIDEQERALLLQLVLHEYTWSCIVTAEF